MKIYLYLISFIILSISVNAEYFINLTNYDLKKFESEYNVAAKSLKKKKNVDVYFCLTIKDKNTDINEFMKRKQKEIMPAINWEEKAVVVIYELETNTLFPNISFQDSSITDESLKKIQMKYIFPFFQYIEYRLDKDSGNIILKYKNKEDTKNDSGYIKNETYGILPLSFINGFSKDMFGIELVENRERTNLFKGEEMREKALAYDNYILKKAEDDEKQAKELEEQKRKEIESRERILKEEKDKKEREKEEKSKKEKDEKDKKVKDEKDQEQKANAWDTAMNFTLSYNYTDTSKKTVNGNAINPLTNAIDEVYENTKTGKLSIAASPAIVSKDNGELRTSCSYEKYDDYIQGENDYSKMKFDYLKGTYYADSFTARAALGDFTLENSSYLLLNDTYRGFYGSAEFYLQYNPNKWSYKRKIEKGLISKDDKKAFKVSAVYAPTGEFIGIVTERPETTGFLVEAFIENYKEKQEETPKYKYHLGYVYGKGKDKTIENMANEIVFEGESKIVDKVRYQLKLQYMNSEKSEKNSDDTIKITKGQRFEGKLYLVFDVDDEYLNLFIRGTKTSEGFSISSLTKTYVGTDKIPSYINEKDLDSGSGGEIRLNHSLFHKKMLWSEYYANFERTKDDKYAGAYREIKISNETLIGKFIDELKPNGTTISASYNEKVDYENKQEDYLVNFNQLFSFNNTTESAIKYTKGALNLNNVLTKKYVEDIQNYEKLKYSQSLKGYMFFPNISNYHAYNSYIGEYSFTKEHLSGVSMLNSPDICQIKFDNNTSIGNYKNDEKNSKYFSFNNNLIKDINFNFFNIFKEDSVFNINMNNYFYHEEIGADTKKKMYGNMILMTLPIKSFMTTNIGLQLRENKNEVTESEQKNIVALIENEYGLNKLLRIYLDYTYKESNANSTTIEKVENISSVAEEENIGNISSINNSINTISSSIVYENKKVNNVGAGLKLSILQVEEIEKNEARNKFDCTLTAGGGYETTETVINEIKETANSIYASAGNELTYIINKNNKVKNILNWQPYFKDGKVLKEKYIEKFGYKLELKEFTSNVSLNYTKEMSKEESSDTEELVGQVDGIWKIDGTGKSILQFSSNYNTQRDVKQFVDMKLLENKILFRSRVYEEEKSKPEIDKSETNEIKKENVLSTTTKAAVLINNSNIFLTVSSTFKRNVSENFDTYALTAGGNITFLKNITTEISGNVSSKNDLINDVKEENSNIALSNSIQLLDNIKINTSLSYYVITSQNSDVRKISFQTGMNMNRVIINNMQLQINFKKEVEKIGNTTNNETNSGNASISISF